MENIYVVNFGRALLLCACEREALDMWRLALRGACPFPRCPGVPVSTHCPLDQLLNAVRAAPVRMSRAGTCTAAVEVSTGCGGELGGTLGSTGKDEVPSLGACVPLALLLFPASQPSFWPCISLADGLGRNSSAGIP